MKVYKRLQFSVRNAIPRKPIITKCKPGLRMKQARFSINVFNAESLGRRINYFNKIIIQVLFANGLKVKVVFEPFFFFFY